MRPSSRPNGSRGRSSRCIAPGCGRRWNALPEPAVLWQSILGLPTGYARASREILTALDEAGVPVAYEYVYGPGTPFRELEVDAPLGARLDAIRRRPAPARPDVSVVFAVGEVFSRGRGRRRRIGYTMLEVDGFPAEWIRQANAVDEVWVPAAFNRDALLAGGVTRPVYVMPLGADTHLFHPGVGGYPSPHGDLVFLSSFEWGERKSPELLLTVVNQTFRRDEPVVLVCKVMHTDPHVSVRERIARLPLRAGGGRIAFLFNKDLPDAQLPALYRSAACYVSAGRGEGWDLPLVEAMACGLPSIATAWGAHLDYHDESVGYPLAIRGLVPARSRHPYHDGFRWADPDPEHLAVLLRRVADHAEEAAQKGRRAAALVAEGLTWKHAAGRIAGRLRA